MLDRNGNIEKYKIRKVDFQLNYDDGVSSGLMYEEYKPMTITYGNTTYLLTVGYKVNGLYSTYGFYKLVGDEFTYPDTISGNMGIRYDFYTSDNNCIVVNHEPFTGYDKDNKVVSSYEALLFDENEAWKMKYTSRELEEIKKTYKEIR